MVEQPIEAKKHIGYLPEGAPAYADMTPAGFLDFVAAVRGFDGGEREKRVANAIEATHLDSVLYRPIDTLSKGFKRRVGLAQALLHDPDVMILDEPTDGLDPNQKHHVRTLLQDMAKDKAIIISTHILEEVDAVCTRAIVIAKRRIVVDAKPAELEARSRYHNAVALRLPAEQASRAHALVAALPGVARVEDGRADTGVAELIAFPDQGAEILDPVCRAIEHAGLALNEVFVERGRLDEVFRQLTQAA